jgi:cyclic 2,3-diphosphoglycerate synthetase
VRAVAIVDGEHYPPVVLDAITELPFDVVAAVLAGGTEKLRGDVEYGVPVVDGVENAISRFAPDLVIDLSDEPVLGPAERLSMASRVLVLGIPYVGADFRFDPPEREPFTAPSVAVVGTGKRVGKTAVTGRLAQLAALERHTVVVAMGRGGPAEPELVAVPPTVDTLVALSQDGRHAASDHLETAALTGVQTIGCRRCGGGLAGATFTSNIGDGAKLASDLDPSLVIFDGSGAAIPSVATDRTIVVVGGGQEPSVATGYLNEYRLRLADLVLVSMAEVDSGWKRVGDAARRVVNRDVAVAGFVLRPRPQRDVSGRHVAYFCTAPPEIHRTLASHLEEVHGATVVHVSGNLADRPALEEELSGLEAEVFLVELKAAAVDVVAEHAAVQGVDVVLAANDPIALSGKPDLDSMLLEMARIRM